jgi:hypothetical protein
MRPDVSGINRKFRLMNRFFGRTKYFIQQFTSQSDEMRALVAMFQDCNLTSLVRLALQVTVLSKAFRDTRS